MKFDPSGLSEEELEWGFRGTYSVAARAGHQLVERHDFSSYHTALDVGGGSGGLAAAVAESCPHLEVTVVDLPRIIPITKRLLKEKGALDHVDVIEADVVGGQIKGSFDVAVARALIQVLPPDQALDALRNIGEVIKSGGRVHILGHILDDSRSSPPEEAGYGLSAVNFHDLPAPYTEQEHRDWLVQAGFEGIERGRLPNGDGVMSARRPE
jgi:ubiquinone/menaquinone biosynthesis C-methylase UbiE